MNSFTVDNLNVQSQEIMITPEELKKTLPVTYQAKQVIAHSRQVIKDILDKNDHRLLVVVGPCSIHDVDAALEYAKKLKILAAQVQDTIYIVMRVYFEKPRTTVGWKGLINDPHLDNSFNIEEGLHIGRKLLLDIAEIGLPTSTEALDPISPQYIQDLISWSAIGARTTESQIHREMASGLLSPVGFKNGTDGGLKVAINALKSVSSSHRFLGVDHQGKVSVIQTKGNPYSHMVLRGGSKGSNYDAQSISDCEQVLKKEGLMQKIMVDCSHANSNKDASRQPLVVNDITQQIIDGNNSIVGLMIESHLNFGNQAMTNGKEGLKYGISITDACIDWDTTEKCIMDLAANLYDALPTRIGLPYQSVANG
jgi:3-deoxy-7-phosphoheptulonate synthase